MIQKKGRQTNILQSSIETRGWQCFGCIKFEQLNTWGVYLCVNLSRIQALKGITLFCYIATTTTLKQNTQVVARIYVVLLDFPYSFQLEKAVGDLITDSLWQLNENKTYVPRNYTNRSKLFSKSSFKMNKRQTKTKSITNNFNFMLH